MKQLTKKEKLVASCVNPYYIANTKYIKSAKQKAKGHYWYDSDYEEFYAISKSGKRKEFIAILRSWDKGKKRKAIFNAAKKAAKLWAAGKYKEAREVENQYLEM